MKKNNLNFNTEIFYSKEDNLEKNLEQVFEYILSLNKESSQNNEEKTNISEKELDS